MLIALAYLSIPKDKNTIDFFKVRNARRSPYLPKEFDKHSNTPENSVSQNKNHSTRKRVQNISPNTLDRHYTIQFYSTKLNKFSTNQRRSTSPVNGPAARTHAPNDARTQGTRKQTSSSRHETTECWWTISLHRQHRCFGKRTQAHTKNSARTHTSHPQSHKVRRKIIQRNTNQNTWKLYSYAKHTNTISINLAHADIKGYSPTTHCALKYQTPNLRSEVNNKSPLRRYSRKTTNRLNNRSKNR